MNLKDYAKFTKSVAVYPPEEGFIHNLSGLCGEAGEFAAKALAYAPDALLEDEDAWEAFEDFMLAAARLDKLCKAIRRGEVAFGKPKRIPATERLPLQKEHGDTGYYWVAIAENCGFTPEESIATNVEKLSSRKSRGVLKGDGDER